MRQFRHRKRGKTQQNKVDFQSLIEYNIIDNKVLGDLEEVILIVVLKDAISLRKSFLSIS